MQLGLFSLYKQAQLLYKGYAKESIFSIHIIYFTVFVLWPIYKKNTSTNV